MRGAAAFLLGILCGAALLCAGLVYLLPRAAPGALPGPLSALLPDPCKACGAGTRCEARICVAATPTPAPAPKKKTRRARPAGQDGVAEAPEAPEPPPLILKPAELKPVSMGDKLTQTEVIDLSKDGPGGDRELDDEAIDRVWKPAQAAVLSCLEEARGEAQMSGRLTVAFRVQRSGAVSGMRLEAPAYLVSHGLYNCVRPVVMGLRFPPSSRGQVVTYPFTIR